MVQTVHAVIWLSIVGIAFLIPNVLAVGLALGRFGGAAALPGPVHAVVPQVAPKAVVKRSSPKLLRKGYLWKALSPLLFGFSVVLGLAVGDLPGYGIMGLGLLNLAFGALGWDAYIPGKMRK